ncbi:tungsten-containing aldehyde ferredoxin oxidoreductase [Calderihabitans maritimus]|uniref:Tungsten-containing aldehyde ferredoxin oxidoreductase n=1 Tax=Calderihabitans maritimus TaxID=1246530 RepID=A0A1Z5HUN3_9FIRM|nr:tungsten-containing aldehyde ferredoxin oxidoreductase [Calderihabitans maritimus]
MLEKVQFPGAQALVIGPAGENLVRFACLENNYWRSAGRTGMGAVMGSKKLKAIVFHGRAQCPVADEDLLRQCVSDIRAKAKDNKGVEAYQRYGTPVMVALMNSVRAFPTRYWSEGMFSQWEKVSGDYLRANYEVKSRACPRCLLACGKLTTVKDGPRRGLQVEGPEYETIYSFGGLCCIDNMDEILHLNDLCDRLGLDTITTGNLIALTMEATEQGKLKEQIRYGDAEAAARLVKQIAFRQGLGDVLAEGIVRASRELGMQDVAVHVKGLEPAGYDPRVLKGMALGYATSARGACHLRATFYKAELSGIIDPDTIEGKAELYCDWEDRLTIFNTMIFCVFFRDLIQWEDLIPVVKATTGLELSRDELRRKANDIITLTRLFNWENGFRRKDDALPKRLLTEPVKPSGKQISEEQFNRMLDDYYRIRGWDEEGKPVNFRL